MREKGLRQLIPGFPDPAPAKLEAAKPKDPVSRKPNDPKGPNLKDLGYPNTYQGGLEVGATGL